MIRTQRAPDPAMSQDYTQSPVSLVSIWPSGLLSERQLAVVRGEQAGGHLVGRAVAGAAAAGGAPAVVLSPLVGDAVHR